MANRRFIDFPIASTIGDNDIILIWQDAVNKQITKQVLFQGVAENISDLLDVDITALADGQVLEYDATSGKWVNVNKADLNLGDLNDVSIISPSNGQVLVYNSSTGKWENSSGGYVPYTGAVDDVDLGNHALTLDTVRFNDLAPNGTLPRQLRWNREDGTLDLGLNNGGVIQQIGLETYYRVKNQTGVTITDGTLVMASGTLGASGRILITPAVADGSVPSRFILGIATEDILNGEDGFVTHFGSVRGIDTTGTPYGEVWADGDVLWANPSINGGLTNVEPSAPNLKVSVAIVINSAANGTIFVRPNLGMTLTDLHDVDAFSPSDKDLISYDLALGHWNAKSLGTVIGGTSSQFLKGDGTLDSNVYALNSALANYQLLSEKGQPNGYASLDSNGKVPLTQINDSIIGQVEYMGLWNASANTPTLPTTPVEKGHYYIVSVAGTQFGISFEVGDWIISDGTSWGKVDNTDAVSSVFGRTGNVVATEADYQTFYPRLSQSYSNPSWISSLAWSKITGTPTTLGGYGIIDAVPNTRTITAGTGLTGGGDLSANRTLSFDTVWGDARYALVGGTNATGTWGISVTGNAATSTILQTARLINGTSFNGSADITTSIWGTARTLTIGSTGKSVNGSANVSWSLAEIGAQAAGNYVTTDTTQTITAEKNINNTFTFFGNVYWKVSTTDDALQRVDARDDATNFARMHWYGQSDTGAVSNFRHAWYDGASYVNVTVNSGGRIDFAGAAASMYIGSYRVFDDGYHPNADTWTTPRTITIGSTGKSVNGSTNVSWSLAEIGAIGGSGTTNYVSKFTGAGTIGNSAIYESGGNVGIGTSTFAYSPRVAIASVGENSLAIQTTDTVQGSTGTILYIGTGASSGSSTYGQITPLGNGGTTAANLVLQPSITNGNVLIGTTTDAGQKLQVNGDMSFTTGADRIIGYGGVATGNTYIKFGTASQITANIGSSASYTFLRGASSFVEFTASGIRTHVGGLQTSAPLVGSNAVWKLGDVITITTAATRSVRVEIGGTMYYLLAYT